jgi:hypothetical protein
MKKLITSFVIVLAAMSAMAQGEVVNKYFNQYASNDQFTKLSVSSKMFSMFTQLDAGTPEEKEFLAAIAKIKGMKVLVGDSITNASTLYTQANTDVDKAGFEELMSVIDGGENMRFSIKESNGIIQELIMVMGGKGKFVMMSIYGQIDLKNISKIARSMNIDGMKNLEKLDDDKKKK